MHTSQEAWGADAREFKPERWLGPDAQGLEQWMCTFSKGARMCIGQKYVESFFSSLLTFLFPISELIRQFSLFLANSCSFAPAEIILTMGYLFTRYKIRLPDGFRKPLAQDVFTLMYSNGLDVVIERQ
jgi:hypothetical protein